METETTKVSAEAVLRASGYKNLEEAVQGLQRKHYGPRYVGASLSDLALPTEKAQTAVEFMKKPKHFLVYHGSPGCGKTRFCAALMEWAFTSFKSFRKYRDLDLLSKLRDGIRMGEGDYAKSLELMVDDDLIILDDVGSGINPSRITYKDLEWRREIFFDFLDNRYNSMKPTIITSNFTRNDFDEVYSDRISSRLFASENKFISLFGDGVDKRAMGF